MLTPEKTDRHIYIYIAIYVVQKLVGINVLIIGIICKNLPSS